jgi:mono/diheme cytochrome c family protein
LVIGSAIGRRQRATRKFMSRLLTLLLTVTLCSAQEVAAPRIWNDEDLADWAAPVVGVNARPGHFSEQEYQEAPLGEWVRTYPVYFPGREPAGYWEMLQNKKPEPLITPGARTPAEWIAAGRQVFRELDFITSRSYDPKHIAIVRSAEEYEKLGGHAQPDGTVASLRWVPTSQGLALSIMECAGCHTRTMPDGSRQDGAPDHDTGDALIGQLVAAGTERFYGGETTAMVSWRSFAAPWIADDVHADLKTTPQDELDQLLSLDVQIPGTFARFNGSPYYTTKIPDLIGVGERKYIDASATHRVRNAEDIARYAALITCCDSSDFGPHRMLSDRLRVVQGPYSDDLLYALAQYVVSIEPPPNPHAGDPRAPAGEAIFEREGCVACHTPPLYTNNKLTLAQGYKPPDDHPFAEDILPISVGTDPNLALRTRKGTGLYKIPSLKGVWYHGLYGHDGSAASLEEWFNPARLRDDYVPTGFKGYKVEHRAVPGHEFGLSLTAEEKAALIAFLRTL